MRHVPPRALGLWPWVSKTAADGQDQITRSMHSSPPTTPNQWNERNAAIVRRCGDATTKL